MFHLWFMIVRGYEKDLFSLTNAVKGLMGFFFFKYFLLVYLILHFFFPPAMYDWIAIMAGIVQSLLYADFFYLYITKVLRGKALKLPT